MSLYIYIYIYLYLYLYLYIYISIYIYLYIYIYIYIYLYIYLYLYIYISIYIYLYIYIYIYIFLYIYLYLYIYIYIYIYASLTLSFPRSAYSPTHLPSLPTPCSLFPISLITGTHNIDVFYAGHRISGSPFHCKVFDAAGISVGDIMPTGVGQVVKFKGQT